MTREEAIHIIDVAFDIPQAVRRADENRTYFEDEVKEAKAMAIEALEGPKWIAVSEKLPKEFESVLVCYDSQGGMAQAVSERFGTHTGYRWSALAGIEPIAWMSLPKPYRG